MLYEVITIRVTVTVKDRQITFDYSATDAQTDGSAYDSDWRDHHDPLYMPFV